MKTLYFFLIFSYLISGVSLAQDLLTITSALPAKPYAWIEDDQPGSHNMIGVGMNILHAFFDELKIGLRPQLYPWARSLQYARSGEIDALLTVFHTEERTVFLDFCEPYLNIDVCVIVPKGKTFVFEKWDDLDRKSVV